MPTIDESYKEAMREVLREELPVILPQILPQLLPQLVDDGPFAISVEKAAEIANVCKPTVYDWLNMQSCDFCLPVGRKKNVLRHRFIAFLERLADQREGTA